MIKFNWEYLVEIFTTHPYFVRRPTKLLENQANNSNSYSKMCIVYITNYSCSYYMKEETALCLGVKRVYADFSTKTETSTLKCPHHAEKRR